MFTIVMKSFILHKTPDSPYNLPATQKQNLRQIRRRNSVGDLRDLDTIKKTPVLRKNITDKVLEALTSPDVLNKRIPVLSEKNWRNYFYINRIKVRSNVLIWINCLHIFCSWFSIFFSCLWTISFKGFIWVATHACISDSINVEIVSPIFSDNTGILLLRTSGLIRSRKPRTISPPNQFALS
jgi:hypothetical protein